jgi:hypothetical protein
MATAVMAAEPPTHTGVSTKGKADPSSAMTSPAELGPLDP